MLFASFVVLLYVFRSFIFNISLVVSGMLICAYSDRARHTTRTLVDVAQPWLERTRKYMRRTLARAYEAVAAQHAG
jgi:hypothetical protein